MSKINIIVAYYNNLAFIDLINMFSATNLIIYDKSSNSNCDTFSKINDNNTLQIQMTDNIGREGETYLKYIIENYENLPEYNLFIQDDVNLHITNYNQFVRNTYHSIQTRTKFYQYECTWGASGQIYKRTVIDGYIGLSQYRNNKGDDYTIKKIAKKIGIYLPKEYGTETCAFFLLHKHSILKHPKQFYIKLRDWLLEDESNGYYLEHMWTIVFQDL